MNLPNFNPFVVLLSLSTLVCQTAAADTPRSPASEACIETRIDAILSELSPGEMAEMIRGRGFETYSPHSHAIPKLLMVDGALGPWVEGATSLGSCIAIAATWNKELAYDIGQMMGKETRASGNNTLLGPTLNIHRTPHGGRNHESYGEDPFLSGTIATEMVRGIQSEGVIATIKHFAANNQELNRHAVDARVSRRALNEIYLPAFEMAVKQGGALAVMSAYNKVNGAFCAENPYLLLETLKQNWEFNGIVMSDWGGTESFLGSMTGGLDLEMPTGVHFTPEKILQFYHSSIQNRNIVEDKVRRILRVMLRVGLFDDRFNYGTPGDWGDAHRQLALQTAREGIVLLQNNGILPLKTSAMERIAVIGPLADLVIARSTPSYEVSPLEGIQRRLGDELEVIFSPGCSIEDIGSFMSGNHVRTPSGARGFQLEFFNNHNFEGEPVRTSVNEDLRFGWSKTAPIEGITTERYSVRVRAVVTPPVSGTYGIHVVTANSAAKVRIDGAVVSDLQDQWTNHLTDLQFTQGESFELQIDWRSRPSSHNFLKLHWHYQEPDMMERAIQAARQSDAVIMVVGLTKNYENESNDRESLRLPPEQETLVREVSAINPNTIVVLSASSSIETAAWRDRVSAILMEWYPGQEGGTALAEILAGDVSPSGRLPTTFLEHWSDSPAYGTYLGQIASGIDDDVYFGINQNHLPPDFKELLAEVIHSGRNVAEDKVAKYVEDIFVGYRWYDRADTPAAVFPFGHGLSYTQFEYSNLKLSQTRLTEGQSLVLHFEVENTGSMSGAEVTQLYLQDNDASLPRPIKELKGFQKIFLAPGQRKQVSMTLYPRDLQFFSEDATGWQSEPGDFTLHIGSSSRDIRLKATFSLN